MAIIALALIAAAVGVGATRALFLDTGSGSGNQVTSDFIIAFDDLESGGFAGGFGWLDSWAPTGAATVTSANTPYEGTYHLEVDKGAEVVRSLDLSGETLMRLQFRGKVTSLTGNRQGRAEVSSDGVVWNVVRTWTSADPGGVYQYEDIDLSPYTMSSQFWVKFKLDGGGGNRLLHVDNVTYASRQALPATPTPTATPIPPPAPPTNLVATPGNAQVALNWDDNTEPDLNGYNVYRSTTPGGPYTKVNGALVAVSDYADTGLTNGTTYYYVVRAENTSALESGNSNEASATPIDAPPAAPTGLVATPASAQVSLDWADNAEPDLAGYNVYRSTSTGGPYTKVNGALVTVSNYTDTGLTNGTTYYYVVRAEDNGTNESGNSSEVSATPAALPPAAPTGLVATAGGLQISLNWDDNTEPDLAGYNVYRSTATGGPYTKVNGALVTVSGLLGYRSHQRRHLLLRSQGGEHQHPGERQLQRGQRHAVRVPHGFGHGRFVRRPKEGRQQPPYSRHDDRESEEQPEHAELRPVRHLFDPGRVDRQLGYPGAMRDVGTGHQDLRCSQRFSYLGRDDDNLDQPARRRRLSHGKQRDTSLAGLHDVDCDRGCPGMGRWHHQ